MTPYPVRLYIGAQGNGVLHLNPAHRVKTGFSRGHGVVLPLLIFGGDNGAR